ncbi:sulfatase-like hydrolase/transferase [Psychrosphaera algicola]|uniref:Sulfatase-like hydrolase/transferase n=1 Tax=Psychrosphaera algicola TaxID=3023714 RepID=A0ABT5FAI0_9GAMM|nr:sulfatase-like hydrolase/transferase [Psychrosphaera sp. G1-22]MDC2888543.1 sulfatase-like hydrolase/transferase [Psychrosphaera sp. G1-22]
MGDPARGYTEGYKSKSGGYIAPFKNPFINEKPDDQWLTDRLTDEAIAFMGKNADSPFFINLHFYAPHRPSIPRSEELLKNTKTKRKNS